MQRFVSLIIIRFQNINPEKEGKTVNGPVDVKSELRMITVEDKHFSMWKRIQRMSKPNFSEASVWLWIHKSDVRARQSADFVKWIMPEYEFTYFVYRSSRNERLNDAKTRAPPAAVYLLFLLKRGDDRTSRL